MHAGVGLERQKSEWMVVTRYDQYTTNPWTGDGRTMSSHDMLFVPE